MIKNLFILLIFGFTLFSCGELFEKPEEEEQKPSNDNRYGWNSEMRASKQIIDGEAVLGREICSSLKRKRDYIKRNYGDNQRALPFRMETFSCGDSSPVDQGNAEAAVRVPRSGEIYLERRSGYTTIRDMLTDTHARLNFVCSELLASRNPQNTITDGDYRYQISFFKDRNRAYVQIAEFSKSGSNFRPYLIDISRVLVAEDAPNDNFIGFVATRRVNRPCELSRQTRYLDQSLRY